MESMIELDIHKNQTLLSVKERGHKIFICPWHKDLYDENYFGLDFNGQNFVLTTKQTNCLALDKCGIPPVKKRISLADLEMAAPTCTPGGGCC